MKNKNIIKTIVSGLCVVVLLAGCSDFLDVKPKMKDIPEKIAHYNGMFNNNNLMGIGWSLSHTYMTDELIATAESFSNMSKLVQNAYRWDDDIFVDDEESSEFNEPYSQIYIYNVIAHNVMDAVDGTEQEKREILAEARVSRAFMYMMLAQWFGKPYDEATAATDLCVPIVTVPNSNASGFNRSTVKEVWDFIVTELEEACPDLKEVTKHSLRVYKAAGYMILGRAYMLTYRYADAVTAFAQAEQALSKTEITLDLFDYNEMIWEWGYDPDEPYAWIGGYPYNFAANNVEVVFNKQVSLTMASYYSNATVFIKPEAYALFHEKDHRRKMFADKNYTGTIDYPYFRRQGVRSLTNEAADMAHYYLQYAECAARSGNETKARELVSYLRNRRIEPEAAAIPSSVTSRDDLVRFIVEEGKREFMCTGHRWFEMRRLWNDPLFQADKADYTHTDGSQTWKLTEERLTLRIPSSVLSHNSDWQDNE